MNITIRISADDLPTSSQKTIKQAFGVSTPQDSKKAFEKIAKAAFLEYCEMIYGSGTPSKLDELRKQRLFFLICHYFNGNIPNETEVEKIFHLGLKSKSLLTQTISHYKNRLPNFNSSLLIHLNKALENSETQNYEFECTDAIIEQMNDIVKQNWPTLEKIRLKRGTSGVRECQPDTYVRLKKFLNG